MAAVLPPAQQQFINFVLDLWRPGRDRNSTQPGQPSKCVGLRSTEAALTLCRRRHRRQKCMEQTYTGRSSHHDWATCSPCNGNRGTRGRCSSTRSTTEPGPRQCCDRDHSTLLHKMLQQSDLRASSSSQRGEYHRLLASRSSQKKTGSPSCRAASESGRP